MRTLSTITDPVFIKPEAYSAFDRFWLRLIRDERDLPFVHLTLRITFVLVPLAVLMYLPFVTGWVWWAVAAAYFYFNNFVFKGPFGLMLHCTSHRKWFKQKYEWMNMYLPWFVGLFFGQTPETYYSHHIGMHHPENNLEDDESSTMNFQRDSFAGFMRYFLNFFFTGLLTLIQYLTFRKRFELRKKAIRGEAFFILMCVGLCLVNWPATVMVFILPFFLSRFIMMLGNWAQHAFVDRDEPGNCYKNSITCINTSYNHKCWNDGYHISHHLKPAMHWTLHPEHFLENRKEYSRNRALVFDGIHFLHVWWYLMWNNYEKLAAHIVNLDGEFASDQDAIDLMKQRTLRIPPRGITARSLRHAAA